MAASAAGTPWLCRRLLPAVGSVLLVIAASAADLEEEASSASAEPDPQTFSQQVKLTPYAPAAGSRLTPPWAAQLPALVASCVFAGLVASQAVYYDDDGDPTGLDQIPGGPRQAKRESSLFLP